MGWIKTRLEDICLPPQYGAIASASNDSAGPRFVRQTDIKNGRIAWETVPNCNLPETEVHKYLLQVDDLLVSRLGSIGISARVTASNRAVFAGYLVRFQVRTELASAAFVGYQLQSPAWKDHVENYGSGAVQPTLNARQMGEFEFLLPPLTEQHAIAAKLGALDDKIESNRRSQNLIEDLVRAIVSRALESSEGAIGCLSDYCSLIKHPVRIHDLKANEKYISFEHMPKGSITLDKWGTQTGLASEKSSFRAGDILFGKLRPYFKKVGIAPVDGVCSSDILVLRPRSPQVTALVAIVASSDSLIDSVSAAATGTRMPRASWRDISRWPLPQLLPGELQSLSNQVSPLIDRLISLTHEQQKLIALRDTLVPALLKGEIAIEAIRNG